MEINNNSNFKTPDKNESVEQLITSLFGFKLYKQTEGFSQAQLYQYGGREDCVFTLSFKEGSISYKKYGDTITGCFYYTLKERLSIEENPTALNNNPYVKFKQLELSSSKGKTNELLKEGFPVEDISEIIVNPMFEENNTFPSKENRIPDVLNIPFEPLGGGKDIGWIYGILKEKVGKKIGLMPEDKALYLAYKLILDRKELTDEEKRLLFNCNGQLSNNDVAYHYLSWKDQAGIIKENEKEILCSLWANRFYDRIGLVKQTLDDLGLSSATFIQKNPKQAVALFFKTLKFNDISYNVNGEYPLYLNFKSFLHIYFRHVKEMDVSEQFKNRDKFQLEENDVLTVIRIVMRMVNPDYQAYKKKHPNGRFFRKGDMAYYYCGDYYNMDINPDGSISTFYRGTHVSKKNR